MVTPTQVHAQSLSPVLISDDLMTSCIVRSFNFIIDAVTIVTLLYQQLQGVRLATLAHSLVWLRIISFTHAQDLYVIHLALDLCTMYHNHNSSRKIIICGYAHAYLIETGNGRSIPKCQLSRSAIIYHRK